MKPPTARAQMAETLRLLRGFLPHRHNPAAFYDLLGEHNSLCETSRYNNLGYWEGATTYDEAGEAMAALVARHLGPCAGMRLLDAGCGFADQDLYWVRAHGVREIQAVNISGTQVASATARVQAAGLAGAIHLVQASATVLPFADGSFDGVVSIEAALHFEPREQFFREAARVLKPGGRLVVADSATLAPVNTWPIAMQLLARMVWRSIHVPPANMIPAAAYKAQLEAAGFARVEVISIGDKVFPGYAQCVTRMLARPDIRRRINPVLRAMWRTVALGELDHRRRYGDYIIAIATR